VIQILIVRQRPAFATILLREILSFNQVMAGRGELYFNGKPIGLFVFGDIIKLWCARPACYVMPVLSLE